MNDNVNTLSHFKTHLAESSFTHLKVVLACSPHNLALFEVPSAIILSPWSLLCRWVTAVFEALEALAFWRKHVMFFGV